MASFFCLANTKSIAEEKPSEGLPLYYWDEDPFVNFGDYLSIKLIERIVNGPVEAFPQKKRFLEKRKLLGTGSILYFALDNDVVWGSGINGKTLDKKDYWFSQLDIRSVRGPLTRQFLIENFNITCPEIYGDPALLFPYLFPEFRRKQNPTYEYIIVVHYCDQKLFPKEQHANVVYATDPWNEVIEKILDSKFVISSALHGIILAEAYGIPARMLRVTEKQHLFKYADYYLGTNRPYFQYANSVEEALRMGGESPCKCDVKKIYEAFPFDFWPNTKFNQPNFEEAL